MLSSRAKYALKALSLLAKSDTPLRSREVGERTGAPLHFIESILFELKSKGFVVATRGRFGGYRLQMVAADISYADIVRAIDGPIALIHCASRTAFKLCDDCDDPATCEIRRAMTAARDAAAGVLEKISIGDLSGTLKEDRCGSSSAASQGATTAL